jgi:hypothetical protein
VQEPGNPQSLNRYSYTLNNPQNYIDPSGYFLDKLFKWIGNLFKPVFQSIVNLFKRPQLLVATLAVGIITGGVGWLATGSMMFAGAVGGAAAGAVGAAMTGGNIWQGALIGFVGGAVGGGVTSWVAGGGAVTFGSVVAGGFAGGAVAGGVSTAFYGGDFFENALGGGITSALSAAAFYGTGQVSPNIADIAGKIWNLQNTAIGLSLGFAGLAIDKALYMLTLGYVDLGGGISFGNNALQFTNNPLVRGAITLGNTVIYGGSPNALAPTTSPGVLVPIAAHELQHTYQGQLLGPFVGLGPGGSLWHGPFNFMERGPLGGIPRAWP